MRSERGFTLVELLIVIVVIAILAAIVMVAYGNVTSKARDSGYQSDASEIVKYIETYNADAGSYPTAVNSGGTFDNPSGVTLTASLPANIRMTKVTAAPTTYTIASSACSTASTWAICQTSSSNVKNYAVWLCSAGANVYYLKTTGTSGSGALQTANAGAGCS